jgi:macrolide transport system ATP-binding/permease protein
MSTMLQDIRYGMRLLLRTPALTVVAVLSLALGIGANTTIFTLVNAVLLNPLRVRDISRLVTVDTVEMRDGTLTPLGAMSRLNYVDVRDRNDVFSGIAAAGFAPMALSGGRGEPEQVFGQAVTGNYFDVLGTPMAAGRTFAPDEDSQPGAHPVVVLSYGLWQRRFGGRPDIVGDTIVLNGSRFTVIGVTAEGFRGANTLGGPELWVPLAMYRQVLTGVFLEFYNARRGLAYQIHARLKDGVTIEQARANVAAIGKSLEESFPTDNRGRSFQLRPLAEGTLPPAFRNQLLLSGALLMAIVGLVLLIACGNVANLLLARATARRQEIAVRLSLGASRLRLMRQLLTESLLLAALGGAGGIALAFWARSLLWAYRPPFLQAGAIDLSFDSTVAVFTIAVSLVTGILFGLAPALQSSRPNLVAELKERTSVPSGSHWYSMRNLLVVGQVGLSFVALVSAGLFLRSLANAQKIDPGFDGDRLMMLGVNAGTQGYDEPRGRELYRRMRERLSGVGGVEAVTISTAVPLFGGGLARTIFRDDQDANDPRNGRLTQLDQVAPGYFETLGIPIVRGRSFTANDRQGSAPVVIVNETLAKQMWPHEEALGRRLRLINDKTPREIVGVAKTIKYNFLGEDDTAFFYLPLEQNYSSQAIVLVRSAGDPGGILGTVRRELQQLEPTMPLLNVNTYPEVFQQSLWAPRMGAWLLGIFAGLALLLAAIGLYGVMAYGVSQRTRELGIRLALGARQQDVRNMVVRQGLILALGGVAIGLAAAFALARLVTNLLFGVAATDPVTFTLIPIVLLAVALLASYLPAWRASRVNPVEALRL